MPEPVSATLAALGRLAGETRRAGARRRRVRSRHAARPVEPRRRRRHRGRRGRLRRGGRRSSTACRVKVHRRFGTAVLVVEREFHVDVTSARTEYYARPGALPTVERSSLRQDLFRRDFTINAMAACLEPSLLRRHRRPVRRAEGPRSRRRPRPARPVVRRRSDARAACRAVRGALRILDGSGYRGPGPPGCGARHARGGLGRAPARGAARHPRRGVASECARAARPHRGPRRALAGRRRRG